LKKIIGNDNFRFALLLVGVLVSRIPFLADGYGLDGDSWSVALSAKLLHDVGVYEVSRLPGYPVQEWLSSLVINGGPFAVNFLSAIFSTICVAFFVLLLKALRFKRPYLAGIAFAAVPVFYIHSTTAIDYNFALAFILGSFFFLVKERLLLAGLFLGLAIGCRITSGAMLIPFIIIILRGDGIKENLIRVLKLSIPAGLVGALLFYPVYADYGWNFFTFYEVPYPPIPKVLYKFSIEVWGLVGILGLILATGILFLPNRLKRRQYLFPRSVNERYVIAWLVAIDLYIIAFLKLPMESGYLIPLVPFVILIFGKYLYDKAFEFLCFMLILSPFIATISPEDRLDASTPSALSFSFNAASEVLNFDVLKGPIIAYKSRRQNGERFVEEVLGSMDTVKTKAILVSGRWYNQLLVQQGDTMKNALVFKSYLNENEAVYYFAKGFEIYYMPKQDYYNKIMRGIDLNIYGAEPYIQGKQY
jgi:hypothetical protein